jgi:hypothetical protein
VLTLPLAQIPPELPCNLFDKLFAGRGHGASCEHRQVSYPSDECPRASSF